MSTNPPLETKPLQGGISVNQEAEKFRGAREEAKKSLLGFLKEAAASVGKVDEDTGQVITPEEIKLAHDKAAAIAANLNFDTSTDDNGYITDLHDQVDLGRVLGTVVDGGVEGVGNLVNQVGSTLQDAYQSPDNATFDANGNPNNAFVDTLARTQQLGQKLVGDPLGKVLQDPIGALGAFEAKTNQLAESIPRELINTGIDLNNVARGYQQIDPLQKDTAFTQHEDNRIKGLYGRSAEDLLQSQPAVNFAGDLAPYVVGGVGVEKALGDVTEASLLSGRAGKLLGTGAKSATRASALKKATQIAGVVGSEAGMGAVGTNPGQGTPRTRLGARAAQAVTNAAVALPTKLAKDLLHLKTYKQQLLDKGITDKELHQELDAMIKHTESQGHVEKSLPAPVKKELPAIVNPKSSIQGKFAKKTLPQLQKLINDKKTLRGELEQQGMPAEEIETRIREIKRVHNQSKKKLFTRTERIAHVKQLKGLLTYEQEQPVKAEIVPEKEVPTEKATIKAENAKAVSEYKAMLSEDGIPPSEVDAMLNADKPDGKSSWVTWTNWAAAKTGLGELGYTLQGVNRPELVEDAAKWLNIRLQIIERSHETFNPMVEEFAKALDLSGKEVKEQHLDSGKFRGWWDGLVENKELTPKELAAYETLKGQLIYENKNTNIKLMEDYFGFEPGNLDPTKVSDAASGTTRFKFDVTDVPKNQLDGLVVWETDGTDPITGQEAPKKWVTLDYGNGEAEIVKSFNDAGDFYYKRKYPFLYKANGEFDTRRLFSNKNPHRHLLDLRDANQLTAGQMGNLRTKFFDGNGNLHQEFIQAGYDPKELKSFLSDVADGNISPKSLYSRSYRMFAGSLTADKGIKLGVAMNVPNAYRVQQIRLANKLMRDNIVSNLREQAVKNENRLKKIMETDVPFGGGQPGLNSEWRSLSRENDILKYAEKMVRNIQPEWMSETNQAVRAITEGGIEALNKLTGKNWSGDAIAESFMKNARTAADKFLWAETVMKMGLSISGGIANYAQAGFWIASQLADDDVRWNRIISPKNETPKQMLDRLMTIQTRMHNDPHHGALYKNAFVDSDADVAFLGKGRGKVDKAVKLLGKAALAPAMVGIKAGQLLVYSLAENIATDLKLKGEAKSNFILNKMIEASQVPYFTKVDLTQNKLIKARFFLQNFMFKTFQYLANTQELAVRHGLDSIARKKITPKARQALFKASVVALAPVLLAGVQGNPQLYLAYNYMLQPGLAQVGVKLPTLSDAKASEGTQLGKQKSLKDHAATVAAYGAQGYLGQEGTALQADPASLNPMGPMIGANEASILFSHAKQGISDVAAAKEFKDKVHTAFYNLLETAKDLAVSQTAPRRIGRAYQAAVEGKTYNSKGVLLEKIPEEDRLGRAVEDALGLKSTKETQAQAKGRTFKGLVQETRNITAQELDYLYKGFRDKTTRKARIKALVAQGVSEDSIINGLEDRLKKAKVEESKLNKEKLVNSSNIGAYITADPDAVDTVLK